MKTESAHLIGRIDQLIRDYFLEYPKIEMVKAKDLMPLFIEKEIFSKDHRGGLPIRNLLRELDSGGQLALLKHCKVKRNAANRNWFFMRKV